MPKNLQPFNIGHFLLGITTIFGIHAGYTQQLHAQETDRDRVCRLFPLNTSCRGYTPPTQQSPVPPLPPLPAEPSLPPREIELPPNPSVSPRFPSDEERSGFAINGKAGTLGLGLDVTGRILPNLNARVGFNAFSFSNEREEGGINYDTDTDLRSGAAMLDYYPVRDSGLRITGGLIYNGNKLEGTGKPSTINGVESFEIGDRTFTAGQVGDLEADVKYPDFAPYVGIGWGNAVAPGKKLGFFVDLGVMLQGSPEVNLSASNATPGSPLLTELQKERLDLKDDVDDFKIYPVFQIGVTYQF